MNTPNPTPETPTPLGLLPLPPTPLTNKLESEFEQAEYTNAVCKLFSHAKDLERALAEAKREIERLKADKARIDWLEAQKIVSLNKSALREEWEIESVQDDFRARRYTGDLRAAIDAARTTQEGQG